ISDLRLAEDDVEPMRELFKGITNAKRAIKNQIEHSDFKNMPKHLQLNDDVLNVIGNFMEPNAKNFNGALLLNRGVIKNEQGRFSNNKDLNYYYPLALINEVLEELETKAKLANKNFLPNWSSKESYGSPKTVRPKPIGSPKTPKSPRH